MARFLWLVRSGQYAISHVDRHRPSLNLDGRITQLAKSVWGDTLLWAFVCTIIPSFMVYEAIACIGAACTSIVGTVEPIVTVLLAEELLGNPLVSFT